MRVSPPRHTFFGEAAIEKRQRQARIIDANDAAAIRVAVSRPSMRFVPVKNPAQQDIQALHRVREQLIRSRTALVNQVRGLLGGNGIVVAQGIGRLRQALPSLLEIRITA